MEAFRKKRKKKKKKGGRDLARNTSRPPLMALVWGDSAGCLFLGEQVTGQTFDWIPHTVTSEGGGIVPWFFFLFFSFLLQRLFPSTKHFLLHFEKKKKKNTCCLIPEVVQLSRKKKKKKNKREEKNTRSLRFFIWRTPVTESSTSWQRKRRSSRHQNTVRSTKSESQYTHFSFFKCSLLLILISISTEESETKLQTRSCV